MQIVDVTAKLKEISFSPTNEVEEILQNVKTILTTTKYSVPLDRKFGINAEILDMPLPYIQAKLTAEIISAIQKYEPRVVVNKVIYNGDGQEGKLIPTVRVMIK